MRNGIVMLVLVAATAALLYALIQPSSPTTKSYSDFETDVKSGSVATVVRQDNTLTVTKNDSAKTSYTVIDDSPASGDWAVLEGWGATPKTISYSSKTPADTGWIVLLLSTLLPVGLVVLLIFFLCARPRVPTTRP
jgi:ATP-dependent Zn protease